MITKKNFNALMALGLIGAMTSYNGIGGGGSVEVKEGKQLKPRRVIPKGCSVFIIEGEEIVALSEKRAIEKFNKRKK